MIFLMPYADPAKQSEYQVAWAKRRRDEWFAENGPCVDCGSWDDLRLDHVDASLKVDHKLWSWSAERRAAELEKCVARCHPCHVKKTVRCREHAYGARVNRAVLTDDVVREARQLYASGGFSWPQLGERFGVKHNTLRRACKDFWKHVED